MHALTDPRKPAGAGGQALVEFALAIIVFLMLLMAIFDFGRGIYTYNGLSQAAREVARSASVHQDEIAPYTYSAEAQLTIGTQQALVPGLTFLDPVCVIGGQGNYDPADPATWDPAPCDENEYLVVTAKSTYKPVSLLGFLGTIQLEAQSRIQIPLSQTK